MFASTGYLSAKQKEKLFLQITKFLIDGCNSSQFSQSLYRRVSGMFGFIAHHDRHGFIGEYFSDEKGRLDFIDMILNAPCYGDPEFSNSDVEREVQTWLKVNEAVVREACLESADTSPQQMLFL